MSSGGPFPDARQFAPAAERNREPILAALRGLLPERGTLLEIASGSGQHVAHFAAALSGFRLQPTDADPRLLASIDAWVAAAGVDNVARARQLDVLSASWPVAGAVDAVFCANMIHIAPWECCEGLMRGAARHLSAAGQLFTYGPYRIDGQHTAPSNAEFDASLRARDARWGVRDLEQVAAAAQAAGLLLADRVSMPANNHLLRFVRDPAAPSHRTD